MEKIKSFKIIKKMPILISSIMLFILTLFIGIKPGDDAIYSEYINNHGAISWLIHRYFTWGSRIYADLVLALVNFNLPLWRLLNSVMYFLTFNGLSKIILGLYSENISDDVEFNLNIFLNASFWLMYPFVITSSALWITGSFNYLWMVVPLIYSLYPLIINNKEYSKIKWVVFFICGVFASFSEQSMAILFATLCIFWCFSLFKNIKRGIAYKIYTLLVLSSMFIFLVSPGRIARLPKELHWEPNFLNVSMFRKLLVGVTHTNAHILNLSFSLVFIITLFSIILLSKKKKENFFLLSTNYVFLFISILKLTRIDKIFYTLVRPTEWLAFEYWNNEIYNKLFDLNKYLSYDILTKDYLAAFLAFLLILVFALFIIFSIKEKRSRTFTFFAIGAALFSGYSLAFSPTIFASGSRIFFITDLILVMIIGILFLELKLNYGMKTFINSMKYIIISLVTYKYLYIFALTIANVYPWM